MLRKVSPSFTFLRAFGNEMKLDFVQGPFCINHGADVILSLHSVGMHLTLFDFLMSNHSLHTWEKSHLVMAYVLFNMLLDSLR